MATITIYGWPPSTYTRTARMYCVEKGVDHVLEPIEMGSEAHKALHPFSKIPIMQHGDFRLCETPAIGRYIDESFEGPALQPADPKARAVMTQWITMLEDYLYGAMVRGVVLPRVVYPMQGKDPDEALIAASMPNVTYQLSVLNDGLAGSDYLAGDAPSLADWLVEPVITYLRNTPDAGAAVTGAAHVAAWHDRMMARPSFAATMPPPPEGSAAA
ncbi:MAG: glutathione S-transferase family protein [Bauldia litoralis]